MDRITQEKNGHEKPAIPKRSPGSLPMLNFQSAVYDRKKDMWLITCYDHRRDCDFVVPVKAQYLRQTGDKK